MHENYKYFKDVPPEICFWVQNLNNFSKNYRHFFRFETENRKKNLFEKCFGQPSSHHFSSPNFLLLPLPAWSKRAPLTSALFWITQIRGPMHFFSMTIRYLPVFFVKKPNQYFSDYSLTMDANGQRDSDVWVFFTLEQFDRNFFGPYKEQKNSVSLNQKIACPNSKKVSFIVFRFVRPKKHFPAR